MDHAPFIWSSYGIVALVLLWTAVTPLIRKQRTLAQIRQLTSMEKIHDTNP